MSATITWVIQQLDRQTSDGFVTTAHWRANAVDGDYSASVYGTCGWSEGEPVIPYDQLTQDTVLGWVWADGVDKDATEATLNAQIALQKNPVTATGVPW
jgi:hypothetical protein